MYELLLLFYSNKKTHPWRTDIRYNECKQGRGGQEVEGKLGGKLAGWGRGGYRKCMGGY